MTSGAPPDDELLLARAYLNRVAEAGNLAVTEFVADIGPRDAARRIRAGDVPATVDAATAARRDRADPGADLDAAAARGIRLLCPESPDWPHLAFAALHAAQQRRLGAWTAGERSPRPGGEPTVPLALWVRGDSDPSGLGVRCVAMVGARAATAYGEHVAADLGYGMARHDVTVVSGGAFGIDAAAHRGALAAGGPTVLVSAGGLDRAYPLAHAGLFEQVASEGLLISESPPGAAPHRHRFLSRNRIIAALSTGTVVIEAARRSGALNTAAHCVALGRPLMAVPGPVTSALSAGCHDLLSRERDPAVLVTGVDDVLALVGAIGEGITDRSSGGPSPPGSPYDQLDAVAQAVLDGLPARGWVDADALAARAGVAALDVVRALPVLGLAGLVESGPEGYRLKPSARGGLTGRARSRTVGTVPAPPFPIRRR